MLDLASSAPEIIEVDASHAAAWDAYVDADSGGSFYHRFAWKHINEKTLGHRTFYLAARDGGRLCGVLPLVLIRSRVFGRMLCSLPFVNYGGPCAHDLTTIRALLQAAQQRADAHSVDYMELRSLAPLPSDLPTLLHKASMTLTLTSDPETLWAGFATKHRTAVRRAYKNGLRAVFGGPELLNSFYTVLAETWRAHGTPIYAKRFFADVLAAQSLQTRICVVYADMTPVAAAFNGHHQGTVEGLWAGNRPRYAHLQANYVLYWEMIKRACEEGYHTYHLGRSTVESGGEFFKKKWNAEAKQLYWQYYLPNGGDVPQLNVNNPKYRLAIRLWRQLPLFMTTAIGPIIAGSIP